MNLRKNIFRKIFLGQKKISVHFCTFLLDVILFQFSFLMIFFYNYIKSTNVTNVTFVTVYTLTIIIFFRLDPLTIFMYKS
jgi:hypothetical protein